MIAFLIAWATQRLDPTIPPSILACADEVIE